jgi:hypothetical protein
MKGKVFTVLFWLSMPLNYPAIALTIIGIVNVERSLKF